MKIIEKHYGNERITETFLVIRETAYEYRGILIGIRDTEDSDYGEQAKAFLGKVFSWTKTENCRVVVET